MYRNRWRRWILAAFVVGVPIFWLLQSSDKINEPLEKLMTKLGMSCQVDYIRSLNGTKTPTKKIIFYMGDLWEGMGSILQFDDCEYPNCIFQTCYDTRYIPFADAVVFAHDSRHVTVKQPAAVRQRQLWFVYGVESPAYEHYRWSKSINEFNGTMTYLQSSIPSRFPYGFTIPKAVNTSSVVNYAAGKTKGAYAYVSNCNSKFYDRLKVMKELSKYIEVDIYGGCTGKRPCPSRFDAECEAKLHSQYRFYLAFENSLCTEYITEKFYKSLQSEGFYVPVALGGLAIKEYERIAPPNSFIHVYNFSSIEKLGKYLKHLMTDDAAYNRYHEWRNYYTISMLASKKTICDFCKTIHHPESLEKTRNINFADEFNKPSNCKTFG
ncbi:alpha-(1,3)-fucosyltransferase fut-1-like [Watersipora subatra]|uniref:alpha-(1,3)-fucosyltransferase fut-1-like n=1 Tax=Watersipora subatra TaxID=2589382 RepID=UPI00355BF9E2